MRKDLKPRPGTHTQVKVLTGCSRVMLHWSPGAPFLFTSKRNKVCVCVLCVCLSCPFLLHTRTSDSKSDVFTPSTTNKPNQPRVLRCDDPRFFFFFFWRSVFLKRSIDEQSGRHWSKTLASKCLFKIKGPKTRGRTGHELVVRNKWRKEWADEGEYEKNN